MLKVYGFLTKREGMGTEAFIEHYEKHHVPLVLSLAPSPIVYKRNYLVQGDEFNREEDTIDFDIITELVFPDRAGFVEVGRLLGDHHGRRMRVRAGDRRHHRGVDHPQPLGSVDTELRADDRADRARRCRVVDGLRDALDPGEDVRVRIGARRLPGPWGVEVLSEELRNVPIEQIFDRAAATTAAQLTG